MDIRSGRAVAAMAMGSPVGHLVYGVVPGLIYGPVPAGHREEAIA